MTDLPQTIALLRKLATAVIDLLNDECANGIQTELVYLATSNATIMIDLLNEMESRAPAPLVDDTPLITAAHAVIDRWETPLWKDLGPTADCINALRRCLAEHEKGKNK